MLSRNAASSRAIPVAKMIESVKESPAMPEWWGKTQKGMQANKQISQTGISDCRVLWNRGRNECVEMAGRMVENYQLHKQIANRLLEPWMHMTSLWTATEWDNFFALRAHPDAQPEFQVLAYRMLDLYLKEKPLQLQWGEWHLPFVDGPELTIQTGLKVSVARAARVSYTTFEGKYSVEKDCELHDRMLDAWPKHMSPFEHQACAVEGLRRSGNFAGGWQQYRKSIKGEVVKKANLKKIMKNKPDWIEL